MSFWENDSSFSFDCKPLTTEHLLKTGLWLGLIGINETPPHVALLNAGLYYSVSASKVDSGSPLERLLNVLERKNIPTVFVGVGAGHSQPLNLGDIYKDFQPLSDAQNTCLSPIKEFFAKYYSLEFESVNYVFELLALAEKKNLLEDCFSVHVELAGSNKLTLPKYTMVQIKNRIIVLSQNHKSYLVNHT